MEYTAEVIARQREERVRREVAHARPTRPDGHPARRRAASALRRLAGALDDGSLD